MAQEGIKEFLDCCKVIKDVGNYFKEHGSDGIGLTDLVPAAKLYISMKEAFDGAQKILPEIKDMDAEETKQAVAAAVEAMRALYEGIIVVVGFYSKKS